MFGLMKACSCNKTSAQKEQQRLHYCGTCKTIGSLYGHKSRVFLNYDAVFLGEILAALQPQAPQFAPAYVSKNCLAIPKQTQIPWALEYAATTNVILTHFKLLDHIADTGSKLFKWTGKIYSAEFRKALRALKSYQFPLEELSALMSLQVKREGEAVPNLDRLAEPTAGATRLVFQHGAVKTGVDADTAHLMASMGATFGEIAYLVDAIEDQEEDAKKGAFNALVATGTTEEEAILLLKEKQAEMFSHLRALPIDSDQKAIFTGRLRTNLAHLLFRNRIGEVEVRRRGPVRYRRAPGEGCCDSCCCACDCCDTACCCCELDCCCNALSCCVIRG